MIYTSPSKKSNNERALNNHCKEEIYFKRIFQWKSHSQHQVLCTVHV